MLWYSLEVPCQGTSNEYLQHMFLCRTWENHPWIIIKYSSITSPLRSSSDTLLIWNYAQKQAQLFKLLANVMLKFLTWNMANELIFFCWKNVSSKNCKSYLHFCSKIINVFENILATTVNEFVINVLVKLTMLWTTGLRSSRFLLVFISFKHTVWQVVWCTIFWKKNARINIFFFSSPVRSTRRAIVVTPVVHVCVCVCVCVCVPVPVTLC